MTIYKEIPHYPGYRVGDDGTVWSQRYNRWEVSDTWRQLKPGRCSAPNVHYTRLLVVLGRGNSRYVHRLILETFIGPCPPGMEGCHRDGDASNNALTNLHWGTRAENMQEMAVHGRKKGEKHHNAIITEEIVREIRQRAHDGETHTAIAKALGVQRRNVSRIIDRTRWPHVA